MAKKTLDETAPDEALAPAPITEAEIMDKVRAGLLRSQAVEVITAQRLHDATLTVPEKLNV